MTNHPPSVVGTGDKGTQVANLGQNQAMGAQTILLPLEGGAALTRVFCPVIGSDGRRMEEVKASDFKYEKAMRATVEDSLGAIFPDLEIVGHEVHLKNYRFDTVAFNVKTRSFVLIEYKKVQNDQALTQGLAYLRVLEGNEGNFLEACKDKNGKKYEKDAVVWNKTKVFLVAPSFTDRLLKAVEQIKEPIELYRITKYENKIITVEVVVGPKHENGVKKPTKDISLADRLYNDLERVLHGNLHLEKEKTKVYEKWLSKNGETVCTVAKQVKSLILCYTTESLNEVDEVFVKSMIKNGKKVGKRGSGAYKSKIQSTDDVKRAVKYLEQVCRQKEGTQKPQTQRNPLDQDDMLYVTQNALEETTRLYIELKKLLRKSIPNLEVVVMKRYLNWKSTINGASIFTVAVQKKALKISYNTRRLDTPRNNGFVRNLSDSGGISVAGLGNYDSKIITNMDVKKAIYYIEKVHAEKVGQRH